MPINSQGIPVRDHDLLNNVSVDDHHAQAHAATHAQGGNDPLSPTIIVKASNESVTSSTTLQNDDDFVFAVGANEVWVVEITGRCSIPDAAGMKIGLAAPSGTTFTFESYASELDSAAGAVVTTQEGTANSFNVNSGQGSPTRSFLTLRFLVRVSTSAGNVQFQWAQNASSVSATTLKSDMSMIAHKV